MQNKIYYRESSQRLISLVFKEPVSCNFGRSQSAPFFLFVRSYYPHHVYNLMEKKSLTSTRAICYFCFPSLPIYLSPYLFFSKLLSPLLFFFSSLKQRHKHGARVTVYVYPLKISMISAVTWTKIQICVEPCTVLFLSWPPNVYRSDAVSGTSNNIMEITFCLVW